jgi:hypothetical protein
MLESLSNVVTTRANIGLRKMDRLSVCLCPTGASLACQEPLQCDKDDTYAENVITMRHKRRST